MGHKMGCNGVDNGRLKFNHYAVPRESLLNAFSDVTADGTFSSSIAKPRDRFLRVRAVEGCSCCSSDTGTAISGASSDGAAAKSVQLQDASLALEELQAQAHLVCKLQAAFAALYSVLQA
jgi:acyl-CoA oxidase